MVGFAANSNEGDDPTPTAAAAVAARVLLLLLLLPPRTMFPLAVGLPLISSGSRREDDLDSGRDKFVVIAETEEEDEDDGDDEVKALRSSEYLSVA